MAEAQVSGLGADENSENVDVQNGSNEHDMGGRLTDSKKCLLVEDTTTEERSQTSGDEQHEENGGDRSQQKVAGAPKEKRRRKRNTRAGRALLGVGKILEQYRQLHTEQGVFDVDEDDSGSIQIGGRELTFASWGQVTRAQDEGIVRADFVPQVQKRKHRPVSPIEWHHVENQASTSKNTSSVKKSRRDRAPAERDEGEISDSDMSDSASSDSDDDAHKRPRKKDTPILSAPSNSMPLHKLFATAYKYREMVVQSFTIAEKMAFLNALRSI